MLNSATRAFSLIVLLLEINHLMACRLTFCVSLKTFLPGLQKLLAPFVIDIRYDPLPPALLCNTRLSLQSLKHDPDLLLCIIPSPGPPFDLPNDTLR